MFLNYSDAGIFFSFQFLVLDPINDKLADCQMTIPVSTMKWSHSTNIGFGILVLNPFNDILADCQMTIPSGMMKGSPSIVVYGILVLRSLKQPLEFLHLTCDGRKM